MAGYGFLTYTPMSSSSNAREMEEQEEQDEQEALREEEMLMKPFSYRTKWKCNVNDCYEVNYSKMYHREFVDDSPDVDKCLKCGENRMTLEQVKIINAEKKELFQARCKCGCNKIIIPNDSPERFDSIPIEALLEYILPELSVQDICQLSMVSKDMKCYFGSNEIWKVLYIHKKVDLFHEEKLIDLSEYKSVTNQDEIDAQINARHNKCTMVIQNKSENIPIDVYYCKDDTFLSSPYKGESWTRSIRFQKMSKTPVLPGADFICCSYPGHQWFCLPTKEWLIHNPQSNVGYSFIIDILKLVDHTFGKTNKLCFVSTFYQPRTVVQIKGTEKKFECYKHMLMRLVVCAEKLHFKGTESRKIEKKVTSDIERLKATLRSNEKLLKETKRDIRGVNYAWEVYNKFR